MPKIAKIFNSKKTVPKKEALRKECLLFYIRILDVKHGVRKTCGQKRAYFFMKYALRNVFYAAEFSVG